MPVKGKKLKAIVYVEPKGEVVPSGVRLHVWIKDLAVTGDID
jgi:hypothetical protein